MTDARRDIGHGAVASWDTAPDGGTLEPMSSPSATGAHREDAPPEVLAVLFPGRHTGAVIRRAVIETRARRGRLRVLQVHGLGHQADRDADDEVTFAAAARALRDNPGLPVTFEAVALDGRSTAAARGEADGPTAGPTGAPMDGLAGLITRRARAAALLVLGDATDAERALVRDCRASVSCDLLVATDAAHPSRR